MVNSSCSSRVDSNGPPPFARVMLIDSRARKKQKDILLLFCISAIKPWPMAYEVCPFYAKACAELPACACVRQ